MEGKVIRLFLLVVAVLVGTSTSSIAQTRCDNPRDFAGQDKIVGGRVAQLENWPGQVSLRSFDPSESAYIYFCGGTLIADQWVLTAAHCVDSLARTSDGRFVRAGEGIADIVIDLEDLRDATSDNVRRIADVIVHENYTRATRGDDIALVELARPWTGRSSRLSMSRRTDPAEAWVTPLMVAGFGTQSFGGPLEPYRKRTGEIFLAGSPELLETVVPLTDPAACQQVYADSVIGDGQICAGYAQGGRDSCQGDSGGPLVTFDRRGCPFQVGVVSWGAGCAEANAYGVYTRISAYADWITQHTGPLDRIRLDEAPAVTADPNELVDKVFSQLKAELEPAQGRAAITINRGTKVQLGEDAVFDITSRVPGRVLLIDINAEGKVAQLFPNPFSDGKRVSGGETFTVPDQASYRFPAQEPLGRGKLVALVVPDSFNMAALKRARREKGFGVAAALSYFQNLIQLIRNATGAKGFGVVGTDAGDDSLSGWAMADLDYEIVR
jgi:secreted trypsin-like serine protease